MDIEDDPWVQSLREQLDKLPPGPDRTKIDQKLSKAISKDNTYTHKGLKDLARAASEICADVGPWAADWYVDKVLQQAKAVASPYQNIISAWQNKEKTYLLNTLAQVKTISPSYRPADIISGISDKTAALIKCLQTEQNGSEADGEDYSGIIFVTRRDTVLALSEVLSHHPQTSKTFRVGCLLGSSESAYRRSFLDITRSMLKQTQAEVLLDFKVGEKNLIVSTSVAEEGIDIQACGSVIRWDMPQNMTSWAQSRGRARRQRSTFILMFDDYHVQDGLLLKWVRLEREMQAKYNEPRHSKRKSFDEESRGIQDEEYLELFVESTG
jgi:endoribonuclease Dicer